MVRVWAERKNLCGHSAFSPPVLLPVLNGSASLKTILAITTRFFSSRERPLYTDSKGDRDVPGIVQFP